LFSRPGSCKISFLFNPALSRELENEQGAVMRLITLLCCFLVVSVASAKDFRVAVVDMQKLFSDFPGTEKAKKKLGDLEEKKKEDLADSEQELKDLQKDLSDTSMLSEKQKMKKGKLYGDKLQAYKETTERVQKELMAAESEMTQKIVDQINGIVAGVAKNKDFDLVLDSAKTVYVKDSVDLTKDVLDEFKKEADADTKDESNTKK